MDGQERPGADDRSGNDSPKTRNTPERDLDRYRKFLEASTDMIVVVGADGTVTYASPSVEAVLGYDPDELIGTLAFEYVHPEERDRIRETFEAGLETPDEIHTAEVRFGDREGNWRWLELRASVELDDPDIEGVLINSRDVTERKTYEDRIESQRDGLEVLNNVVRHDIRNDLQIVKAYADRLDEHVDESGREDLETVKRNAESAIELTRTARDLANVMLQTEENRRRVSVRGAVDAAIDELRSAYPEASVTVDGELPQGTVVADDLLEAVFRNLLRNAVEHNDKETPEIVVSGEVSQGSIEVRIADNGPGVSDPEKETVFGKGTKGLKSGGTGVGLYLVETLVDRYGGDVWVRDNEPEGAVFVVELPIADGESEAD